MTGAARCAELWALIFWTSNCNALETNRATSRGEAKAMRIEQWMTANPLTVRPHDSVAHARAILKEHGVKTNYR